jgi:hypothetical protein
MMDGLVHGASAMMPGTAVVDVYDRIYLLYRDGKIDEAKDLFYRLIPCDLCEPTFRAGRWY